MSILQKPLDVGVFVYGIIDTMELTFGDIVVVDGENIGVIVKSWTGEEISHDVYVRMFNRIENYKENEIERYLVRHKYLNEEEIIYQQNAIQGK